MKKGGRYVPRLCICCMPTHTGEGVDRNGKLWRWEFSDLFGPLFLTKGGDPLTNQPETETHPAWEPFEKWLAEVRAKEREPACEAVPAVQD